MKKLLLSTLLLAAAAPLQAQNEMESFQAFRQNMLNRYEQYRNEMLNRYADYLDQVWKDFDQMRPVERFQRPKPSTVPVAKKPDPAPQPQPMPKPTVTPKPTAPKPTPKPTTPAPKPTTPKPNTPAPKPTPKPTTPKPTPKPTTPANPTTPATPAVPVPVVPTVPTVPTPPPAPAPTPAPDRTPKVEVEYYGLQIKLPKVDIPVSKIGEMGNGNAIKALNNSDFEKKALPALKEQIKQMQLPDYFQLELVSHYAKALLPNAGITERANLMHFMLLLCGFDVRPAFEVSTSTPVLLIPFEQMVYARAYFDIDGKKYFCFTPDLDKLQGDNMRFRTPSFSSPFDQLHSLDLVIRKPLKVKGDAQAYTITQGGITVKGTVNKRLIQMVYKYPQMPVPCYAQSVLDEDTRQEVEQQIRSQIGTQATLTNVNRLLHFVQSGFEYATDDDQFGFEKPYFFEELLYYPKCDCEDRSVFYATLLRKVMGVKNHLINFPNHECVSIALPGEEISGSYYEQDGLRYYISDPTYIGANTGLCMPQYRSTAPKVEPW